MKKLFKTTITIILYYLVITSPLRSQYGTFPSSNPVELGKVKWLRDYSEALFQSQKQGLPILILFQEVPGCSNCTTFGREQLSHPLLVEAIETCFVPLCIYNNKGGADAEVLKKYVEPTWNNPVIRIVDASGADIVTRQPNFNANDQTINTIIMALKIANKEIPIYLAILAEEWLGKADEAYLSMYCFWTGERELAGIEGVIGTEAGFMHGHEVVKIVFDKSRTTLDQISQQAKKVQCADQVYGSVTQGKVNNAPSKYKRDDEDKYYLYKSKYKAIPMTTLQKSRVNRALATGDNVEALLSPRQLAILKDFNLAKLDRRSVDICDIWYK
jgi:hypothetical protein